MGRESLPSAREAEVAAALEAVGLPPGASVNELILHHRHNAALAACFPLVAALDGITAVRRDGSYNTAEQCRDIAREAINASR